MDKSDIVSLKVGDKAPDFTLQTQTEETVSLSKVLAGGEKVLLVIYPGDDTPGCTAQLCGIRDIYKEYKDLKVRVLGLNHGNAKSHQKFIDKYSYPFDILVDEGRKVITSYGALKMFFKNLTTKRGVFLIDTDGIIKYMHWGQQNNSEVIDFIKQNLS